MLMEPERDGLEIMAGQLKCAGCGREYPIVGGVPRFADLAEVEEEKAATAAGFGWEWKQFNQHDEKYGEQLLGWLNPVKPEFFKDKIVLDGGCGKGRHLKLAGEWGVRDVVGVDLSDAVEPAFEATRAQPNIHVVQGDIFNLPFAAACLTTRSVWACSIILLSRLKVFNRWRQRSNPADMFQPGCTALKTTGGSPACQSAASAFHFAAQSPYPVSRFKLPTAILFLATKVIYGPLSRIGDGSAARRLYYGDYLSWLSRFGWREHHVNSV